MRPTNQLCVSPSLPDTATGIQMSRYCHGNYTFLKLVGIRNREPAMPERSLAANKECQVRTVQNSCTHTSELGRHWLARRARLVAHVWNLTWTIIIQDIETGRLQVPGQSSPLHMQKMAQGASGSSLPHKAPVRPGCY